MNTLLNRIAIFATLIFVSMMVSEINAADKVSPYVVGDKSFLEIKDVNRQAEAWAMCVATYDFMAGILSKSQPARSQQLKELANGAEFAVTMTIVLDGLTPDITQERFNALWSVAKLAGTELPSTRRTTLAADAESSNGQEAEAFIGNLSATLEICLKNLEGQQMYIDSWRELAKSGLLQMPKE